MGKTNNKGLEGEETGQKLQIIQLCWEKQRESIKSLDEHFTQAC